MAIITRLKLADRRGSRTLVELDGEEWETLDTEVVLSHGLACSMDLDEEQCQVLLDADAFIRARRAVAISLQVRLRSVVEIERKLREKKFEPRIIERTVLYFTEKGALDDAEFARRYAVRQFRTKIVGPRKVAAQMRQMGVADHHISAALAAAPGAEDARQEVAIRKLIERRLSRLRRDDKYARRRKLSAVLARAGFSPDVYAPICREYLNNMELEDKDFEGGEGEDCTDDPII